MKPLRLKQHPLLQEDAEIWPPPPVPSSQPILDKGTFRGRLGLASLLFAVVSLVLPLAGIAVLEVTTKNLLPGSLWYSGFTVCQLSLFFGQVIAFVMGLITWGTKHGKLGVGISGSVISACLLIVVCSSFTATY